MGLDIVPQLGKHFWPKGTERDTWMIADGARDTRIFGLLLECFYTSHSCLFAGTLAPELALVAPYLIRIENEDKRTRKFVSHAWGSHWGVFVKCDTRQDALSRHLRSNLTVQDPQGRRMLFRYYDPRVLRRYLPSCNSEELERLFGPVECFWTESRNPDNMLEFRFERGKLVQRTLALGSEAARGLHSKLQRDDSIRPEARPARGLLTIRDAQFAVFSEAEVQRFEDWMCAHLRQYFPNQSGGLGDLRLRELIRYGIARAARHEIRSEREVCKFIDLMVVFGRDFDTDARLAWAGEILANRKTARTKIRCLYEAAGKQLSQL